MTTTELYADTSQFVGPPEDVEAILQAHRDWWAANHTLEIERLSRNFAPDTLMFNLNGHTYYDLAEMVQLWEVVAAVLTIDEVPLWDVRVTVSGDLAYVTSEGVFTAKPVVEDAGSKVAIAEADGTMQLPFRETTVLRRDDSDGDPTWKICHFHCSPMAPVDEQRMAFEDTWTSRAPDRGAAALQTVQLPL